ncbi:MAG: hypothetical protein ABSH09_07290 [Bryobacteraceae bacterium]
MKAVIWLENREMRVSALILERQRNSLVEQIESESGWDRNAPPYCLILSYRSWNNG